MLENVPGFASEKFAAYHSSLIQRLHRLGYEVAWRVLNSSDYGVSQLRPRFILVALRGPYFDKFSWPLDGFPRLTLSMTARIQAFPDSWTFAGGKTAAYRQIGNAFPPPVAEAVGKAILSALTGQKLTSQESKPSIYQPLLRHKKDILYVNL
ncbi:MAG TPA: DNA cytosine methyltransferase, partial [Ktedonobacteraceae bacterium]